MLKIPDHFFSIKYKDKHYPGAKGAYTLKDGANCQVFAYEILRFFGKEIPDFRSSELFEDTVHTKKVDVFEPLDILMWNKDNSAWGAHVGLFIGDNSVIHLSKENTYPEICRLEDFTQKEAYHVFIGAKRVL